MATLAHVNSVAELRQKRLRDCRLTADRKLRTIEEAEAFLVDRGVLTLTQDSALPSLFAATHEEAYKSELAHRPGVLALKVHRGKVLLCHQAATRAIDPLARAALAEADAAGDDGSRLVRHLKSAGPSKLDDVKDALGIEATALRKVRERLESVAAIVSRDIPIPGGKGIHTHTSELARWDQVWNKPWKANQDQALAELVLIGVRAAVLAHQDEIGKWFSWPVEWPLLADLIKTGRLQRPGPGYLAIP